MSNDAEPCAIRRREARVLLAVGCLSLLPYLLYHRMFARLFWFGDEFDLVDQIDRMGFWRWMWSTFAENFVPLFKLLWGGALRVFGGSYEAMLLVGWACHVANVVFLGRLLRLCGLPLAAAVAAQVILGFSPANYETLTWTVQWSATLSVTFMLLSLESFYRAPLSLRPLGWGTASALCFSRGVLTGLILAVLSVLPPAGQGTAPWRRRILAAALYLMPAFLVAALIAHYASGNHRHIGEHGREALAFGFWCFALNPLYHLLEVESWGWRTVVLLGLLKAALFVWAIARSRGAARSVFTALLVFDLANNALLGIGRFHTGFPAAVSSRYQYAALVAFAPVLGLVLVAAWERVPVPRTLGRALLYTAIIGLSVRMCVTWQRDLDPFTTWRGTDSRRLLFEDKAPPEYSVPGIPFMPMGRAKALIGKYGLH